MERVLSQQMYRALEKREYNKYTGPSCAINPDPNYIPWLIEVLDKVDPKGKEATKSALEIISKE